jgi:hypothetical protein
MSLKKEDACKHCGQQITHYSGRLWHQIGARVFPQYCAHLKDGAGESYMHEPASVVLDEFSFPTALLLSEHLDANAVQDGAGRRVLTDEERWAHLESYVSSDSLTAHYPVPAGWVQWLLEKYGKVLGAITPNAVRKYMSRPFDELDDVLKLTMIYREVEGANSSGLPMLTVPSSWVVWLTAEYWKKVNRPKVSSILQKTQNGAKLSPRDLEIVRFAIRGELSNSGLKELEVLHTNVYSGEYLDPESPKFPWFHGIKNLTQDLAGTVYWKGQKVGRRPFGKEHHAAEIAEVKQLAIDCIRAETTGSPLPCMDEPVAIA